MLGFGEMFGERLTTNLNSKIKDCMHSFRQLLTLIILTGFLSLGTRVLAQNSFAAKLTGAQEVIPALTTAEGLIQAHLSGHTLVVSGSISGLSSSIDLNIAGGAHIHSAVAGQNGPIALLLDVDLSVNRFEWV